MCLGCVWGVGWSFPIHVPLVNVLGCVCVIMLIVDDWVGHWVPPGPAVQQEHEQQEQQQQRLLHLLPLTALGTDIFEHVDNGQRVVYSQSTRLLCFFAGDTEGLLLAACWVGEPWQEAN